jgi:hypothetical protein
MPPSHIPVPPQSQDEKCSLQPSPLQPSPLQPSPLQPSPLQPSPTQTSLFNSIQTIEKDFELLCATMVSNGADEGNHQSFCFDIYSTSKNGEKSSMSVDGLCSTYLVRKDAFDALLNLKNYQFLKKTYKNINGIYEIQDILNIHYHEENRLHYMIIGQWTLNTASYLTDFIETVLEDRIDNIFNVLLKSKKNAPSISSASSTVNVWKQSVNIKTHLQQNTKIDDTADDVILPNPITVAFVIYDETLYQPPVTDYPVYGIDSHVCSILQKYMDTRSHDAFIVKKLLRKIFSHVYAMERSFFIDKLIVDQHTYGLLVKFSVNTFYIGEYDEQECIKKDIRVTQEIVQNTFYDYLYRPSELSDDELSDELPTDDDLNNLPEEKTENYLNEEEEIF